ncbi:hypothetical protein BC332_15869 [Capsicum chinense]|nr:hypothetical protein BC332_15869 [Capsicum chinense]
MGEIDSNAFQNALKQRFSNQEAEIKAIELLSLWQEKIKDPDWHPFKTIMIDESNVDVRSSFGYFSLSLFLPEYFLLFLLRIIFGIKSFEVKDSGLLFLLVSCPSVLIRSLFAYRATWKNFIVCGWTSPPLTRGRGFDFGYGKNSAGNIHSLHLQDVPLLSKVSQEPTEFSVEAEHDLAKIFESIPALENFCWEHEHVQGMVGPAEVIPTRLPSALNCLKRLYISCISLGDFFDLSFALCLIRSSSNLEDIEILVVNDVFDDIGGDYYESVPQDIVDEIPTSFSDMTFNRLRTVKIYNVTGKMAEMQLMKVLLAKSPALIRMIDQSDPLFIGASDVSGATLIPIKLIGSENYGIWSRSMRITLLGKRKFGFVSVSEDLLSGIVYATSSYGWWENLKNRFNKDLYNGGVKGIGREKRGLYNLKGLKSMLEKKINYKSPNKLVAGITTHNSNVWYKRLRHPSIQVLRSLDLLTHNKDTELLNKCNICPLTKQTRLSFPISETKSNACFDIGHMDLWGPYKTPTFDKKFYFMTVVDDCSRYT